MASQNTLEARVTRLEDRVDRMNETLATKQDLNNAVNLLREDNKALKDDNKVLHGRMNNLTMLVMGIGFLNIVAITVAAVFVRLLT